MVGALWCTATYKKYGGTNIITSPEPSIVSLNAWCKVFPWFGNGSKGVGSIKGILCGPYVVIVLSQKGNCHIQVY